MSKIDVVETGFKLCTIVIEAINKAVDYNQLKEYCKDVISAYRKSLEEIKRITQVNETLKDKIHYLEKRDEERLETIRDMSEKIKTLTRS